VKRSPAVASRVRHGLLVVIVCASLITQIVLTATNGQDVGPGGVLRADPAGTRFIRLFSFFTIQSNVLVLAAAVSLAVVFAAVLRLLDTRLPDHAIPAAPQAAVAAQPAAAAAEAPRSGQEAPRSGQEAPRSGQEAPRSGQEA
jgi:hypothetical protein